MLLATCPVDATHKRFTVIAHITQDWVVNEHGVYLETVGSSAIPRDIDSLGDVWSCDECGAEPIVRTVSNFDEEDKTNWVFLEVLDGVEVQAGGLPDKEDILTMAVEAALEAGYEYGRQDARDILLTDGRLCVGGTSIYIIKGTLAKP